MFFHGEDAVADDLSPFIDAAPREEQKYFLATQQVDEARHSVFFHRFMHEVVERGDGTIAAALRATEPELTWGFAQTFEMLDRSPTSCARPLAHRARARGDDVPLHRRGDARPARPALHRGLPRPRRDLLPGFREGMKNVAQDEQRHIGFGVKLLHDLAARTRGVPAAVADLLREVFPVSVAVFVPPGWNELRRVLRLHARADLQGGRALLRVQAARWPACRSRACPARRSIPLRPPGRGARRARRWRCCARATWARRTAPPRATPSRWRCCSTASAAAVDPRTRARRPADAAVGLPGRRAVAPPARQRLDRGRAGPRAGARRRAPAARSRTGSTSSPGGWTRSGRSPPGG